MGTSLGVAVPLLVMMARRHDYGAASVLGYVEIISTGALITGVRAQRALRSGAPLRDTRFLLVACGSVIAGLLAVLVVCAGYGPGLLIPLSPIGLLGGAQMVYRWKRAPDDQRAWLREHLGGMIGTGIAAHIAFALFGARTLVPSLATGRWSWVGWAGPIFVGVITNARAISRYGRPPRTGAPVSSLGREYSGE